MSVERSFTVETVDNMNGIQSRALVQKDDGKPVALRKYVYRLSDPKAVRAEGVLEYFLKISDYDYNEDGTILLVDVVSDKKRVLTNQEFMALEKEFGQRIPVLL